MDEFINVKEFGAIGGSYVHPTRVEVDVQPNGGAVVIAEYGCAPLFRKACKSERKARKIAATLFDRTFPKPECHKDDTW